MADNKNMALNDEAMAKAAGGAGEDLPLNRYNEGDKVIVQGYEDWDGTVTEVKDYSSNGWRYQVKCVRDSEIGHEEQGFPAYESELSPA